MTVYTAFVSQEKLWHDWLGANNWFEWYVLGVWYGLKSYLVEWKHFINMMHGRVDESFRIHGSMRQRCALYSWPFCLFMDGFLREITAEVGSCNFVEYKYVLNSSRM